MNRPFLALSILLGSLAGTLLTIGSANSQPRAKAEPASSPFYTVSELSVNNSHETSSPFVVLADSSTADPQRRRVRTVEVYDYRSGYDADYDAAVYRGGDESLAATAGNGGLADRSAEDAVKPACQQPAAGSTPHVDLAVIFPLARTAASIDLAIAQRIWTSRITETATVPLRKFRVVETCRQAAAGLNPSRQQQESQQAVTYDGDDTLAVLDDLIEKVLNKIELALAGVEELASDTGNDGRAAGENSGQALEAVAEAPEAPRSLVVGDHRQFILAMAQTLDQVGLAMQGASRGLARLAGEETVGLSQAARGAAR